MITNHWTDKLYLCFFFNSDNTFIICYECLKLVKRCNEWLIKYSNSYVVIRLRKIISSYLNNFMVVTLICLIRAQCFLSLTQQLRNPLFYIRSTCGNCWSVTSIFTLPHSYYIIIILEPKTTTFNVIYMIKKQDLWLSIWYLQRL